MGQIIQSHGMHFFELAGPDLLLGFDADPAVRNVIGLIGADPALALKAVNLRKFGQEIIPILGGRRIHPNFAVPGGVNKCSEACGSRSDPGRIWLKQSPRIKIGIQIIKDWAAKQHGGHQQICCLPHRLFWPGDPEQWA